MAFHKIDNVKINGRNQAFGGFVYSVNMEVGLVDKPTQITISFVNASGQYLEPELSVTNPYRIEIGNIVAGNYYAIKRVINRSSSGRIMEVTFQDGSIILDRLWVGLYKRMGTEDTNIPGLIIVGREVHPCDINNNGVFDSFDAAELFFEQLDPCELRCPNDAKTEQTVINSCVTKEFTDILDVKYSFRELMDALTGNVTTPTVSRVIPVPREDGSQLTYQLPDVNFNKNSNPANRVPIRNVPANINESYWSSYTGTLREVLRNWCADFGWSFYWENDALNFLDTTARPRVNLQAFANLESTSDTRTLEGTVARGSITHYGEPGIEAKSDCSYGQPISLNCLSLADLFGQFYKPSWRALAVGQTQLNDYGGTSDSGSLNPPVSDPTDTDNDTQREYIDDVSSVGVPILDFEKSVVCSFFNEELRHLYNLWTYYGIKDPEGARNKMGKTMDRLGQMKIIGVYESNSPDPKDLAVYNQLLNGYETSSTSDTPVKIPSIFKGGDKTNFLTNKGYFVLAYGNPDLLKLQQQIEQRLAAEFMGQHWYRAYASPFYGEQPQITPNAQYFGGLSTELKDLPFAQYRHTVKSKVSQMVSSFTQIQRNNFRQFDALLFGQTFQKNIAKKNVRSIIYLHKNPVWMPLPSAKGTFDALLQQVSPLMFSKVNIDRSFINARGTALGVKKEDLDLLNLYVLFPGTLKISSEFVDNTYDENPTHVEDLAPYQVATVGLMNKKCVRYTLNGVPVYTPTGASAQFTEQYSFTWSYREPDVKDFSSPTYRVIVSNTAKNRGFIPKLESVLISPPENRNALKVEYQAREVNRGSLRYLNRLEPDTCRISDATLQKAHQDFGQNLTFSVNEPYRSIQYRIMGLTLPSKISIRDGLENLSVRIDEKGVFTDITIGNSLFTPPSVDFITRLLELGINPNLYNSRRNPL